MSKQEAALELLPMDIRAAVENSGIENIEEIRLRCGKRPAVCSVGREVTVSEKPVSRTDISMLVEKASGASLQAHLGEINQGYIDCRGLRIGICGTAVYSDGKIRSFRNFSSLNIRIPHEFEGDISALVNELRSCGYESTLIISPPGYGKTSLLRELIRQISSEGRRISLVDERNELACMENGRCCFDLGECTDIMTGIKKSEGAMMLLRGMNPQIIAYDEISKGEDIEAIYEIAGCGVNILATAHGGSGEALRQRPLYRQLLSENIFKNLICIKLSGNSREYAFERICP